MKKRIETASEVVTVDCNNVVHVVCKALHIPRNFSFAALGKRVESANVKQAMVAPAPFKLFIEDYVVKTGAYDELYESAWRAYGNTGALELSFIIC